MTVTNVQELAARIYLRWREYQERHPGQRVPISTTMSRLFAMVPEYDARGRKRTSVRLPLANPGIFTIQQIAHDLETTVSDLLGEEHPSRRLQLTAADREKLRAGMALLRRMVGDEPE